VTGGGETWLQIMCSDVPLTMKYGLCSHRNICFTAKFENAVVSVECKTWVCYLLALWSVSLGIFKNVFDNLQAAMNFIKVIHQHSYVKSSITHTNSKYLYLM
jgi:hypothetical protein